MEGPIQNFLRLIGTICSGKVFYNTTDKFQNKKYFIKVFILGNIPRLVKGGKKKKMKKKKKHSIWDKLITMFRLETLQVKVKVVGLLRF